MVNSQRIRSACAVFCLSLLVFASLIWLSPFESKGEAREGLVMKSMIEQANFILPSVAGTVPSKPPLFHWGGLASIALFGFNEGAIRLPSALAAALALSFLYLFSRQRLSESESWLTVLITFSSFEWFRSATTARVDMVFAFALFAAFVFAYSVATAIMDGKRVLEPELLWSGMALGVSCGVAFLAKGPPGAIIPWLAVICFVLLAGCSKLWRLAQAGLLFSIPTVIIVGIWMFVAYRVGGGEYFQVQILRENYGRIAGAEELVVGHRKPKLYSLVDFVVALLPWSLFLPMFILWLRRSGRALLGDRAVLFSLIWVALFVALVTISVSKRSVYFLPALPPMAFLFVSAWGGQAGIGVTRLQRALAISGMCVGLILLMILAANSLGLLPELPTSSRSWQLARLVLLKVNWAGVACVVLVAAIFVFYRSLQLSKSAAITPMTAMAVGWLLLFQGVALSLQTALAEANTAKYFMEDVEHLVPPGATVAYYGPSNYQIQFYGSNPIAFVSSQAWPQEQQHHRFVVVREKDYASFSQVTPNAVVAAQSFGFAADGKNPLLLVELR